MDNADNILDWQQLAQSCPWTTPYLLPDFARMWLQIYTDWEPLLIINRDSEGQLRGILPLAKQGEHVTGMGAHQAEYQGWLCHGDEIAVSLDQMLEALFGEFPRAHLRLRYVDLALPTSEVYAGLNSRPNMTVTGHSRPLMELDAQSLAATLRKSSNRSKLNRLRRLGTLEFLADEPGADVASLLDQVIALYDLRQGAVNGTSPFHEDQDKRLFHLNWLKGHGSGLLFYRLMLDDKVIGALLGVAHGHMVSNAIVASSATLAKHSPGKLIIYMAAEHMLERGFKWLDLTPGGDAWKDRFATCQDQVLQISAWADNASLKRLHRRERIEHAAGNLLRFTGLKPQQVRSFAGKVAHKTRHPTATTRHLASLMPQTIEYRVYRLADNLERRNSQQLPAQTIEPSIDSAEDLLLFDSAAVGCRRQDFLAAALERLERGQHCYTIVENGRLVHYGWRAAKQASSFFTEVQENYEYSPAGDVLYDFFTHPSARGRGLYQQTLAFLLRNQTPRQDGPDAGECPVTYISALASNESSIHVIEKLGFEYVESITRNTFLRKLVGGNRHSGTTKI